MAIDLAFIGRGEGFTDSVRNSVAWARVKDVIHSTSWPLATTILTDAEIVVDQNRSDWLDRFQAQPVAIVTIVGYQRRVQ